MSVPNFTFKRLKPISRYFKYLPNNKITKGRVVRVVEKIQPTIAFYEVVPWR